MLCGEIWTVSLAVPQGELQDDKASAIVVQDAAYGRGSPMVLVVPMTEDSSAIGFPGTVALDQDGGENVPDSAIGMVFQLRAIDRTRFLAKIGSVSEDALNEIMLEIDRLTGRTPKPVD